MTTTTRALTHAIWCQSECFAVFAAYFVAKILPRLSCSLLKPVKPWPRNTVEHQTVPLWEVMNKTHQRAVKNTVRIIKWNWHSIFPKNDNHKKKKQSTISCDSVAFVGGLLSFCLVEVSQMNRLLVEEIRKQTKNGSTNKPRNHTAKIDFNHSELSFCYVCQSVVWLVGNPVSQKEHQSGIIYHPFGCS